MTNEPKKRHQVANSMGAPNERQIRSLLKSIQRAALGRPGATQLLKLLEHQQRLEGELRKVAAERLRRKLAAAEAAEAGGSES